MKPWVLGRNLLKILLCVMLTLMHTKWEVYDLVLGLGAAGIFVIVFGQTVFQTRHVDSAVTASVTNASLCGLTIDT